MINLHLNSPDVLVQLTQMLCGCDPNRAMYYGTMGHHGLPWSPAQNASPIMMYLRAYLPIVDVFDG